MVLGIGLCFLALRVGLRLRRGRRLGGGRSRALRDAHLRLAKPAVLMVLVGFAGGAVSAWLLRGWTPFGTFHAWIGVGVAGLFTAAAVVGHRIEEGKSRDFDVHALLGGLALLLAAVGAIAGFVLLP
jgi:uncharacterized membrane protein